MRQDGLPPSVMFSNTGAGNTGNTGNKLTAETLGTRKRSLRVSRSGSFGDLGRQASIAHVNVLPVLAAPKQAFELL